MSCDCNNSTNISYGTANVPVVSAGIKISQLPTITSASPKDMLVVVDYSAQKTNKITFYDMAQYLNVQAGGISDVVGVGTHLRSTGNWVEFDPTKKVDTSDIVNYATSSSLNNHTSNLNIHFSDVVDGNTYLRTSGSWVLYTPPQPLYGNTSNRPLTPIEGTIYTDTDLGYMITYIPPNWVNMTGAIV